MYQTDDVAVIGTPYDLYNLGYTLKVVNGLYPYVPYVAGRNNLRPNTTGGCYQVMTPYGELLLKSWTPTYYNPPLSYNRCGVPRPFGPDYGKALGCGCGGGGKTTSGPCSCNYPSRSAWKKKIRPYRDGFAGYMGQVDAPIGPEWKSTRRIYQSGYFAPEVVYGPKQPYQQRVVSGCSNDGCSGDSCNYYAHPKIPQSFQRIQAMPLRDATYNWYNRPYALLAPPRNHSYGYMPYPLTQAFDDKMNTLSSLRDCKRCYQGKYNPFGLID